MTDITRILSAAEEGDPHAPEQLLPLVYDELRRLAAAKLRQEKPGQTLQATALVHEAYLRLMACAGSSPSKEEEREASSNSEQGKEVRWQNRGHFFAAAAE